MPRKYTKDLIIPFHLYLSKEMYKLIHLYSKVQKMSKGQLVRIAVDEKLEKIKESINK